MYSFVTKAKCSETQQDLVVYKSEETNTIWVRPLKEFTARVEIQGKLIPRFELVKG
jgi:hypothetical protein